VTAQDIATVRWANVDHPLEHFRNYYVLWLKTAPRFRAAEAGTGNPDHNDFKNIFVARISLQQDILTNQLPLSPWFANTDSLRTRSTFQSGNWTSGPVEGLRLLHWRASDGRTFRLA
jgi:hypothetical protein